MSESDSERLDYVKECYSHDVTRGNDFPVSLTFTNWKWLILQADENKQLRDQLNHIKKLAQSNRVGHAIKFDLQMMFKGDAE